MTLTEAIESLSKEQVFEILKKNGLGLNRRRKWKDYVTAKHAVFQGEFIDSDIYDKMIDWIGEFLNL